MAQANRKTDQTVRARGMGGYCAGCGQGCRTEGTKGAAYVQDKLGAGGRDRA